MLIITIQIQRSFVKRDCLIGCLASFSVKLTEDVEDFNVVKGFHEELYFLVDFLESHIVGVSIGNTSLDNNSGVSKNIDFNNIPGLSLIDSFPKR